MTDTTHSDEEAQRLMCVLGGGVMDVWSSLPRDIQELLFERSVLAGHETERDESLREQLAAFLHERHPRTAIGMPKGSSPAGSD